VYDNASGDETEEIVAGLMQKDSRVKYHCHPENIGSYNNFNYGIQEVETPFFSLLSDDDVLAPEFYENAVKAFMQYPRAMLSCMATIVVDTELNVISPPIAVTETKLYEAGEAVTGMIEVSIPSTWSGILFRKEVKEQIGLIDTNVGHNADGGFVYHAAARMPVIVTPGIGAVLMAHGESTSGTAPALSGAWAKWWDTMMQSISEDDNVPLVTREYFKRRPHPDYRSIGIAQVGRALARGDYKFAKAAAQGVRECGYPLRGKMLELLTWVCKIIPLQRVVVALRKLWRYFHASRSKILHRKY
jgi:glycosyltransferase involved in cell wall biosynthesis